MRLPIHSLKPLVSQLHNKAVNFATRKKEAAILDQDCSAALSIGNAS